MRSFKDHSLIFSDSREWSAVHSERNRAMPHIKSYLRLSPCATKAAFFLLTSANISKSAWGTFNKGNRALRINSYEVGVLFLPKFIVGVFILFIYFFYFIMFGSLFFISD